MGRPSKPSWEKTEKVTFTLEIPVLEKLKKIVPKKNRSEYVNRVLKENLVDEFSYAKEQKRICLQQANYWDYEMKKYETDKIMRQQKL